VADREDDGPLARASQRFKTAALAALSKENATHALANKLVAAGLAVTCLAGGINYFDHDDEIHRAVAGFARDAGQQEVAAAVEVVDVKVDDWKRQALARLPLTVRENFAAAALAGGVLALGLGLRLKIKAHSPTRGKVLQDVGRAISGPGFVGVAVFVALSWRGASVVRHAIGSFLRRLFSGDMSAGDLGELTTHYAPWAYDAVGGVLWLGLALLALAGLGRLAEHRASPRARIAIEVARHTATWAGVLAITYYAAATAVAIASYAGALNVIAWPWKVDKGAFLVAVAFMGFGIGLARTGTAELAREKAALGPAASSS
jgi:hypothetical protein